MYKILKGFNVFALVIFLGIMLLQLYALLHYFFIETDSQMKYESLVGISIIALQSAILLGIPSLFSSHFTRKITPHTSKTLKFFVLIQVAISLWAYLY